MSEIITTGYFALESLTNNGRSKVHFVTEGNIPICGSKVDPKYFQWCARGVHLQYLECDKCMELYLLQSPVEIETEEIKPEQAMIDLFDKLLKAHEKALEELDYEYGVGERQTKSRKHTIEKYRSQLLELLEKVKE